MTMVNRDCNMEGPGFLLRVLSFLLICIAALCGMVLPAWADGFPSKPILGRWIEKTTDEEAGALPRIPMLDIVTCGSDYCGILVTEDGRCGETILRISPRPEQWTTYKLPRPDGDIGATLPTKAVGPREPDGKYEDYLVFNAAMDWLGKKTSRAALSHRQDDEVSFGAGEERSCTLPCKQYLRSYFDGSFTRRGGAQCIHLSDRSSAEPPQ
ncbi:hypothetical protein Arad_14011 (plasmid) [Rhizobium rhizogenes K84]|uniref:Uncharacterized protein n=3 Tax=Rhizobium/Agrobacterium group TaxID=227290 RepID=B9JP53_RHIR8|nr:hypothetical protein Arad_14011 [Rhizobium rhizogenes K84]